MKPQGVITSKSGDRAQRNLTSPLEPPQQRALSSRCQPRCTIIELLQPASCFGIPRPHANTDRTLGDSRRKLVQRQKLGNVLLETEPPQAGGSQDDCVVVAVLEPLDARRHVAAQLQ